MRYWFGVYTPGQPLQEVSDLFKSQVRQLREMFLLEKSGTIGHETSKVWREMDLGDVREGLRTKHVFVNVPTFDWGEIHKVRGGGDWSTGYGLGSFITPVLKLNINLAVYAPHGFPAQVVGSTGRRTEHLQLFCPVKPLILEFLDQFPSKPPRARVDAARYRDLSSSHEHHSLPGSWICIFGDPGDWNERTGTVVTVLNVVIGWMVRHNDVFGW